jgi:tRNA(fMet)-specific endonuclease VapC
MEPSPTESQPSGTATVSFLVDTDICSAYMKGDRHVWQRFMQYGGRLHVSSITVGELFTWTFRAQSSPKRLQALLDLLNDMTVFDVTTDVSRKFGELRAALLDAGQGTPDMDLLIAATALVHNLTLVTHNVQDFANLPGLNNDDWLKP